MKRNDVIRSDIRLQPLTEVHVQNMYRWVSDPLIRESIGLSQEPSVEKTKAWILSAIQGRDTVAYAILRDQCHIGNVVLDQIDQHLSAGRLSIYIGEACERGRGIGTAAITQLLKEAFETLKLHKVWLTVHVHNEGAIHLYKKLGFRIEGEHRDAHIVEGKWTNAYYMGMLEKDYLRR